MSYKTKTIVLKRNVIEATILALLPTRFRLLSYRDLCTTKSLIYTIDIKYYGICYYDQEKNMDKLNNKVDEKYIKKLKIDLINNIDKYIKYYRMNIVIDNTIMTRYDINITLTFDDSGELPNNFTKFIKKVHFSIPLYDLTWGYSMRRDYPDIYTILCNKPGYTWEQYYTSLKRVNWLEDYYNNPKNYLYVINSLLYYFAGMDEICLFDIVCKLHLNLKKIGQFRSFIHMRYNLKRFFMNTIPNIDKLCFDDNWRLSDFHICQLNSTHYLKLEYLIYSNEVKINHLIGSINMYNYELFKFILSMTTKPVLNMNINRIKHILDMLSVATKNIDRMHTINKMIEDINNKDFLFTNDNKLDYEGFDEEDEILSMFGRDIFDLMDDLPPVQFLNISYTDEIVFDP